MCGALDILESVLDDGKEDIFGMLLGSVNQLLSMMGRMLSLPWIDERSPMEEIPLRTDTSMEVGSPHVHDNKGTNGLFVVVVHVRIGINTEQLERAIQETYAGLASAERVSRDNLLIGGSSGIKADDMRSLLALRGFIPVFRNPVEGRCNDFGRNLARKGYAVEVCSPDRYRRMSMSALNKSLPQDLPCMTERMSHEMAYHISRFLEKIFEINARACFDLITNELQQLIQNQQEASDTNARQATLWLQGLLALLGGSWGSLCVGSVAYLSSLRGLPREIVMITNSDDDDSSMTVMSKYGIESIVEHSRLHRAPQTLRALFHNSTHRLFQSLLSSPPSDSRSCSLGMLLGQLLCVLLEAKHNSLTRQRFDGDVISFLIANTLLSLEDLSVECANLRDPIITTVEECARFVEQKRGVVAVIEHRETDTEDIEGRLKRLDRIIFKPHEKIASFLYRDLSLSHTTVPFSAIGDFKISPWTPQSHGILYKQAGRLEFCK